MYSRYNKTILGQKSTNKFIDRFNWRQSFGRLFCYKVPIIGISPADFLNCQPARMYKAR